MELTDDERDLILAGLFELTITYVEDDEKRDAVQRHWPRNSVATPTRCSSEPGPRSCGR